MMASTSDARGVLSKMTVPRSPAAGVAVRVRCWVTSHHAPSAEPTMVITIPRVRLLTRASGLSRSNRDAMSSAKVVQPCRSQPVVESAQVCHPGIYQQLTDFLRACLGVRRLVNDEVGDVV